ncbi:acylneuraminate cytidylyltransferase family protein [Vibrio amylolyticus]|uniref:acylneuraminate cytidylyltransferase family protein n=1 Tax=Vibrio amylolyticus TaxID=2847292 RepID=UPI0035518883
MINGNRILAIIPARGGSKRLHKKNILEINGKPLISYTVEAALDSKYIDQVLVSSDSCEILSKVSCYRNVIAHLRPDSLATDTSSSADCIIDAVARCPDFDFIMLLQPTSPLRTYQHIDGAVELVEEKMARSVVSVCECEHSPLWCNTIDQSNSMDCFLRDEVKGLRSQDLDQYYRLNGAIYIASKKEFIKNRSFFLDEGTYAYQMSKESSIDIDDRLDFLFAKFILESNLEFGNKPTS